MNITKTKMLQKMGKEGRTYSADFAANNEKLKKLIPIYEDFVRYCKKYLLSGEQYSTSVLALADCMKEFGEEVGVTHDEVGVLLGEMYRIHKSIEGMREHFKGKVTKHLIEPIEKFVATDISHARQAKDEYRNAKIQLDAAESSMQQACKSSNPVEMFQAQTQYHYAHRKFQKRLQYATNAVFDVLSRKDFEIIGFFLEYIREKELLVSNSMVELNQFDDFAKRMRTYAEECGKHQQAEREARALARSWTIYERYRTRYHPLVKMLSSPDLHVVNAICVTSGADSNTVLDSIVRVLDAHKETMAIIKLGITREVEQTSSAGSLFRGNSCATKLMSAFTRMTGHAYLVSTLKHLIDDVLSNPDGYEVDPKKAKDEDVAQNMIKLKGTAQMFLDSILDSLSECPLPFRDMGRHLQAEVVKRFPENKHSSVGGFIFLRFFCPAILSPDSQGLYTGSLDTKQRRPLILICKALQNLANGIKFGSKEAFLDELNNFIDVNTADTISFFDALVDCPPNSADYTPLKTLDEVESTELPHIHELLVKNLEKIAKNLVQNQQRELIPDLASLLGRLTVLSKVDPPPRPSSKPASSGDMGPSPELAAASTSAEGTSSSSHAALSSSASPARRPPLPASRKPLSRAPSAPAQGIYRQVGQ